MKQDYRLSQVAAGFSFQCYKGTLHWGRSSRKLILQTSLVPENSLMPSDLNA